MIEQGISRLVQGDAGVAGIAVAGGGFLRELPKGQTLPSWTYATVSNVPLGRHLAGASGLRKWHVQIDCYAGDVTGAGAVTLSQAIVRVLNGYRGVLADADATVVDSAFVTDVHDPEYDDASRTWRRVLEVEVNYVSQF